MRLRLLVITLVFGALIASVSGCRQAQNGNSIEPALEKLANTSTAAATLTSTPTETSTATSTLMPTETATLMPTSTATPRPKPTKTAVPPSEASGSEGGCNGGNSGYESTLLGLINSERANNGLSALANSGSLVSVARNHSEDMAENDYFDHNSLGGASPFDRMQSAGISFTAAAENLYAGNGSSASPSAAFAGWMGSEGHRSNMLSSAYTMAGVGYWCESSSTYGGYFTLDLIHP